MQGEWVKLKGGGSKREQNPKGIDIKNRFSILDRLEDESHIVSHKEVGVNDIVLKIHKSEIWEWNFRVEGSLGLERE